MSSVILDGEKLTTEPYYSVRDILVMRKKDVPIFFRITKKYFEHDTLFIETESIKNELKNVNSVAELLSDIQTYITNYPQLSKVEIVALFLLIVKKSGQLINYKELTKIDPSFASEQVTDQYVKTLKTKYTKILSTLETNINDKTNKIKELNKLCEVIPNCSNFDLTNVIFQMKIKTDMDLSEFFNSITSSKRIPYMVYHNNTTLYKVYKGASHIIEWMNDTISDPGIYMKIFSTSEKKLLSKKVNLSSLYSNVFVNKECTTIAVELNKGNDEEDSVKNIITESSKRKFHIVDSKKISFKGSFVINNVNLNIALLAELITNDPLFSYFLVLKEYNKTFLTKKKHVIYFRVDKSATTDDSSEKLVAAYISPFTANSLMVKISKSQSYEDIVLFRYVFSRLICAYDRKNIEVKKLYDTYLGSSEIKKFDMVKKSLKKEDKKTGKRLIDLKTKRPELFVPNYSKECQYKRGPRLVVDTDEIERIKEENEHKIINFPLGSSDWYTCEPRETPDEEPFVWPGLKKNTKLSNKGEYEYVPCCYVFNQYLKKNSDLNKYISGISSETDRTSKGHILRPDKQLYPGRLGHLPHILEELALSVGYTKVKRKKHDIFPILRYGVRRNPCSLIYCLETATNINFDKLDSESQYDIVKKQRCAIFNQNPVLCIQEYYELNCVHENIVLKKLCAGDNFYVDPLKFVNLVAHFYKVKVFMFVLSEDSTNINLQLPNYNTVYLPHKTEGKYVFIILQEEKDLPYQYQCEILCVYNSEKKKTELSFLFDEDEKLVTKIKQIYQKYNQIKFVKNSKLINI